MKRIEIRLIDDLVELEKTWIFVMWAVKPLQHLIYEGAGQIARCGQLQSTGLGCPAQQRQCIPGCHRCSEIGLRQVWRNSKGTVRC